MTADRNARGWPAFDRMAEELALMGGCTIPHARKLLRAVYTLVRKEIEAGHYVMPGVMIVRRSEGKPRYSAAVMLDRRAEQRRIIYAQRRA